MYCWVELRYPDKFDIGKGGLFPRSGQVVKYYREQTKDDTSKVWTQKALATRLGITEQAVRDIESRDVDMNVSRRQLLSELFHIPPILLGVVTANEIE
jgi:ribosome-binding protein aMBF1 (putative translation factor)